MLTHMHVLYVLYMCVRRENEGMIEITSITCLTRARQSQRERERVTTLKRPDCLGGFLVNQPIELSMLYERERERERERDGETRMFARRYARIRARIFPRACTCATKMNRNSTNNYSTSSANNNAANDNNNVTPTLD